MASAPRILQVHLGDVRVGTLTHWESGRTDFAFAEEYRRLPHRPVLGQKFEDDLHRVYANRMRVPSFFSNLLPEGRLRDMVARQVGVDARREYFLLSRVGLDLPGAVIVSPTDAPPIHEEDIDDQAEDLSLPDEEPIVTLDEEPLEFSLAGVQIKYSMLRGDDKGLTLPVRGRGGDWIAKLPDRQYAGVPENEFAVMTWARAAGVEVPDFELRPVSDLHGLPPSLHEEGGQAFVVRRFDRAPGGRRIHMEDFAQVLGLFPSEKYRGTNFETVASLILENVELGAFHEFLRRFVHIIASGNGDAHVKNWSFLYLDGRAPTLSPAYDLVSTIQYLDRDDTGLRFARSKSFEDVSRASFQRLARKLDLGEADVMLVVDLAVERTLESWRSVRADLPVDGAFIRRIETHINSVPLLRGR